MNAEPKSEAATASTVTASESEILVDQNQVADSDETVTSHPFESKPEGAAHLAAPKNQRDIGLGGVESAQWATSAADQQNGWEQVDEGEAPFTKHGLGRPRKVVTAENAADKIVKLPLDKLLPHPLNKKLYGATAPDEIKVLAESLAEAGQLSPLVVTADLEKVGHYTLLSGHKRADALRSLGRTEADCQVVDVKDASERVFRLVEANLHHNPTTEQKIFIGVVYFERETSKAKARQVAGAKATKKNSEVVEVFTQPDTKPDEAKDEVGKARDIAAKKVGMSGVSFERGRKVLGATEKAEQDGKKETAAELRRILNEKGVDPAYSHAESLHLIEKKQRNGATGGTAKGRGTTAKSAPAPQNHTPALNIQKANNTAPTMAPLADDAADTKPILEPEEAASQPPAAVGLAVGTVETDDLPSVVSIIAACNKLADDLEQLDAAELTNDQKWNLTRAFDDISEWFGNHDGALKVPGQL